MPETQKMFTVTTDELAADLDQAAVNTHLPTDKASMLSNNVAETAVVMHPIESSNINSVGYDVQTCDLFVSFGSGLYIYKDVAPTKYLGMLNAESAGKFLGAEIKPSHEVVKLG